MPRLHLSAVFALAATLTAAGCSSDDEPICAEGAARCGTTDSTLFPPGQNLAPAPACNPGVPVRALVVPGETAGRSYVRDDGSISKVAVSFPVGAHAARGELSLTSLSFGRLAIELKAGRGQLRNAASLAGLARGSTVPLSDGLDVERCGGCVYLTIPAAPAGSTRDRRFVAIGGSISVGELAAGEWQAGVRGLLLQEIDDQARRLDGGCDFQIADYDFRMPVPPFAASP